MRAPRRRGLHPGRRAQRRPQGRPAALQVRHEHAHPDTPDLLHRRLRWSPSSVPALPPAATIMAHYARSEAARYYTHRGPCAVELGTRLGGVPVANGTTGLMLALAALAGQRRLVAMPSFTCAAVACAVRWAGLEPLWIDVESEGWQLDPAALSAALDARGEDVAAVIATLTFGAAPSAAIAAGWRQACAAHGTPLIVDAAAALGAAPDDGAPPLDAIGAITLFSLGVDQARWRGRGRGARHPRQRARGSATQPRELRDGRRQRRRRSRGAQRAALRAERGCCAGGARRARGPPLRAADRWPRRCSMPWTASP